jgi:hypothetical protein
MKCVALKIQTLWLVNVESDARYNNPIYSSGVTPFQAGTQVVQTMCENNTKNKHIVSVFLGNKLCNVASRLRNKGIVVKCPNHFHFLQQWFIKIIKIIFDIYFTEFGAVMTTVLPVLFKYCYKYCYSDSRSDDMKEIRE